MPQRDPLRPSASTPTKPGSARASIGLPSAAPQRKRAKVGEEAYTTGGTTASASLVENGLYSSIAQALLDGKLRPGTPLRERYLASEFSLTRGAVRKVLIRLGQEGKLEMHPNRGAFVPQPSAEDIHVVYDARKAVEAGVIALLAGQLTDEKLARLKAHLKAEYSANRGGRRDESIRLAGGFHLALVELVNNPELSAIVQRLVARTQMFVALLEPTGDSGCAPNEHDCIIKALETHDAAAAAAAMVEHLSLIEQRVQASTISPEAPPLAEILRGASGLESVPNFV